MNEDRGAPVQANRTRAHLHALFNWAIRSAASARQNGHIPPDVVDRLLNYVSGQIRGVAAVYNRLAYIDERTAVFNDWARHLESLIQPAPTKVIPITAGRR